MENKEKSKKKVIIINPSFREVIIKSVPIPKWLPLAAISVASGIIDRYDVIILDRSVNRDDQSLKEYLTDQAVICVGLSVLTGPGILDAIHCSQIARQERPDVSIVWGGWHATKAAESILEKPYVDYVIQGEGENVFAQLLDKLDQPESDLKIPGCGYLADGTVHLSLPAPPLDPDQFPPLPYHLIPDIKYYIRHNWPPDCQKSLALETSRGCPMGCTFCEITTYYGKKYTSHSPEKVVNDIIRLKEQFKIDGITFIDPNFFLNINRAREFARLLIDKNLDIKWCADGTISQFKKIDQKDLELFFRAGLRAVIFGIESGSEDIRKNLLNKKFTNKDCEYVIAKLQEAGITVKTSFIIGLPGETIEDIKKTVDFALQIVSRYEKATINNHIFIYMPFPGTPLAQQAEKMGYSPPKVLEEFANIEWATCKSIPWLTKKQQNIVETISTMSFFLFSTGDDASLPGLWKLLYKIARWYYVLRLRKHWFMKTPDISLLQKILP